jgi:hypothetical protein
MASTLIGVASQIALGPRAPGLASLALAGGPILLAARRVVPNAVRLGARSDPTEAQSRLARTICRDHLICLAGIAGFLALQLALGA